jgi:hypothetical protein
LFSDGGDTATLITDCLDVNGLSKLDNEDRYVYREKRPTISELINLLFFSDGGDTATLITSRLDVYELLELASLTPKELSQT